MRIAFISGCAEPGRDGVGDYTRLLAGECERNGNATLRIAINDPYVNGATREDGLLRLGDAMVWRERTQAAREAIEAFNPHYISVQFVAYSFHPRGASFALGERLRAICAGRPVHLMFHEIWIGAEVNATMRHRITGTVQRAALLRMVRQIKPVVIHTSNSAYAALLEQRGVRAGILPLFGAIPLPTNAAAPQQSGRELLRFGMFGELHPVWPCEPLLSLLQGLDQRICLEHIGRMGRGVEVWQKMAAQYQGRMEFRLHGERSAMEVAGFFQSLDFGIATTPLALLGKSGSATAMLEHGLPLVVNRDDVQYRGYSPGPPPQGVIPLGPGFLDDLRQARRGAPRLRIYEVTNSFLRALENSHLPA